MTDTLGSSIITSEDKIMIYVIYGRKNYIPSKVLCRDIEEAERFKKGLESGHFFEELNMECKIEIEEEVA